jgi:hypothetical protein
MPGVTPSRDDDFELVRELAKKEAAALQPYDLFGAKRVLLNGLVHELGLVLSEVPDLDVRGWLQQRYRIVVRAGLPAAARRFAIAHEIGHLILMRRHPELSSAWPMWWQEKFAHNSLSTF